MRDFCVRLLLPTETWFHAVFVLETAERAPSSRWVPFRRPKQLAEESAGL